MQIETERLLLRPFAEADAADLYQYANGPEVGPAAGWPPHGSVEDSRNIIRLVLNGPESYAICKREDGRVIGAIALMLNSDTRLSEGEDECELGYWIGKPFWGQGLVTEASEALLRRAFTESACSACGALITRAMKSRSECRRSSASATRRLCGR